MQRGESTDGCLSADRRLTLAEKGEKNEEKCCKGPNAWQPPPHLKASRARGNGGKIINLDAVQTLDPLRAPLIFD